MEKKTKKKKNSRAISGNRGGMGQENMKKRMHLWLTLQQNKKEQ
jgi:hypothetical protein